MPRVPCLDNLTVSREYNGRIFGKRHAKRIRQTNCWSTVDCRRSQAKFFDRRTDMRAPLYPTVYPILYIPREILLDSFRLFERFSITFYYSAISGWSNELSNVYFFETQWNIFKSYFSTSRLFILVRNELFDVIRYFFETQRNIFRLYFSTFRLFVLV